MPLRIQSTVSAIAAAILCFSWAAVAAWAQQEEPDIAELYERAGRRVARDRPEAALQIYRQIGELAPEDPTVWFNLGEVSRALDRHSDCVIYLSRFVLLAPDEASEVAPVIGRCARHVADGGRLAINAEPIVARIFVDGLELGIGRLEPIVLSSGSHRVRVEAAHFIAHESETEVTASGEHTLHIALEPIPYEGSLVIECNVPDAIISIEGEPFGVSPLTTALRVPARRPLLVRVTKEGYHNWLRRIELEPDQETRLDVTMQQTDSWEGRIVDH